MHLISFSIPGQPIAKSRPRFTTINGKPRPFSSPKSSSFENLVALAAQPFLPPSPISSHISISITFIFQRPLSLLKFSKRSNLPLSPPHRLPHPHRPDLDNCIKSILDGLNHSGIWIDDSLVTSIVASKFFSAIDEPPHTLVSISYPV